MNGLVYRGLLPAVDQAVRSLAGDPHDVFISPAGKGKGTIGHALFQYLNFGEFRFLAMQAGGNERKSVGMQVGGGVVNSP